MGVVTVANHKRPMVTSHAAQPKHAGNSNDLPCPTSSAFVEMFTDDSSAFSIENTVDKLLIDA